MAASNLEGFDEQAVARGRDRCHERHLAHAGAVAEDASHAPHQMPLAVVDTPESEDRKASETGALAGFPVRREAASNAPMRPWHHLFGALTCFVGGETFFDQGRLDFLGEALAR